MIRNFWWGMAQLCRRCAAKGYTGEDCWWPVTADFFHRLNVGARVSQFNGECKACVAERGAARKSKHGDLMGGGCVRILCRLGLHSWKPVEVTRKSDFITFWLQLDVKQCRRCGKWVSL